MGAHRILYQIVGRQMAGKEATGYYIQSSEDGREKLLTREQIIYLVGRGQITNCTGQIYQDKVLLRGEGISLESLPVIGDNGEMRNLSRVPKGKTAQDLVNMIQITARIRDGRRAIGYMVKNYGGQEAKWSRNKVLEFAQNNKIVNAKAQTHNGKIILKGHNCDLTALPEITVEQAGLKQKTTETTIDFDTIINNINNYTLVQKRSDYKVTGYQFPNGAILVNKLEQPELYRKVQSIVNDFNDHHNGIDGVYTGYHIKKSKELRGILEKAIASGDVYMIKDANTEMALQGTVGEMWLIKKEKALKTYNFNESDLGGSKVIRDMVPKQDGLKNYAVRIPANIKGKIKTAWGAVLNVNSDGVEHGKGDFVICSVNEDNTPNLNDKWVVNGKVFENTYKIAQK